MSAAEVSPLLPRAPRSLQDLLYHQGQRYALYHGDSLQLMDQMEPESFDLVFADPPYFLSNGGFTCKAGRRAPVEKGGWDRSRGVDVDHAFTIRWLKACQRVLKPTGTIWVSGTQHVIFSVGFGMQELGFKLLNTVTWFKPNASPNLSCRYFTHSTELLIWAAPRATDRLQHTFNYADMKAQNGGKQMRDLWQMTTPKKSEKEFGRHPTQKPLQLLLRIIQASTHEGDRVLDPFNGSGTTGVAALHLGRRYTGVDIDAAYLATTRKRLEATRDLKSL
ncbi:MAG TPA: DNA methyltransferase [Myxococcales bacterium]|jgi:site-specific DNA-methyltransferase (adenine-specific)|nr:DNA methyltransferase [Myxococcales bacterium]